MKETIIKIKSIKRFNNAAGKLKRFLVDKKHGCIHSVIAPALVNWFHARGCLSFRLVFAKNGLETVNEIHVDLSANHVRRLHYHS